MSTSKIAAIATLLSLLGSAYSDPSQACSHPNRSPIDWRPKANDTKVFQIGRDPDNPREIRVSVPPLYNGSETNLPLILAFHDKQQSPAQFEYDTRFSDRAVNQNKILVYPKAVNDTWQSDIGVWKYQKDRKTAIKDTTDDIAFTKTLIDDLDTVICFDRSRVYATGLGTGGGMVHLLACDPDISTKLAAYAIVAGGFGTKSVSPKWAECNPRRLPAPILEIHGEDDKVLPYLLNDWEPAKSRLAVPHWLDDWTERNGCGSPVGDPIAAMDGTGTSVSVTRLEGGGWTSEAEAYDGGVLRIAKSCPILGAEVQEDEGATENESVKVAEAAKDKESVDASSDEETAKTAKDTGADADKKDNKEERPKEEILQTDPASFTILHYRIRDFGHGWPLQQIKGRKGSRKSKMFDATDLVVDWFNIHKLPEPPAPAKKSEETDEAEEEKDEESRADDDVNPVETVELSEKLKKELDQDEAKESSKPAPIKQALEEDRDEL